MKKSVLIVLLSAAVGGLTAFAVTKAISVNEPVTIQMGDGAQFRTVSLSHDDLLMRLRLP